MKQVYLQPRFLVLTLPTEAVISTSSAQSAPVHVSFSVSLGASTEGEAISVEGFKMIPLRN